MSRPAAPGSVRIVGGRLRGSRLPVADREGLRPTPDRVRETLFNWLQPVLPGASCIDLFAGSGALGLEAASRGAGHVLLVERDPDLAQVLRGQVARLGVTEAQVACADALALLEAPPPRRYDIAFVDPPFASGLWEAVLQRLGPWLQPGAMVYLECAADAVPAVPEGWALHREGGTRDTRYALYRAPR